MVIGLVLASSSMSTLVVLSQRSLLRNILPFWKSLKITPTLVILACSRRRMMRTISTAPRKPLSSWLLGLAFVLCEWMVLLSCVKGRWVRISGTVVSRYRSLHPTLIRRMVRWNGIFGLSRTRCKPSLPTLAYLLLSGVGLYLLLNTFVIVSLLLFYLRVLHLMRLIIVVSLISCIFVCGGVNALRLFLLN